MYPADEALRFQQERFARKNEAAELKRAFDAIDGKKDGKIDQDELGRLFIKLGHTTRLVSSRPALNHKLSKHIMLCTMYPSRRVMIK